MLVSIPDMIQAVVYVRSRIKDNYASSFTFTVMRYCASSDCCICLSRLLNSDMFIEMLL